MCTQFFFDLPFNQDTGIYVHIMYPCMSVCSYVRTSVCTCMHVCMYACTYVRTYVCMYISMYVCMMFHSVSPCPGPTGVVQQSGLVWMVRS